MYFKASINFMQAVKFIYIKYVHISYFSLNICIISSDTACFVPYFENVSSFLSWSFCLKAYQFYGLLKELALASLIFLNCFSGHINFLNYEILQTYSVCRDHYNTYLRSRFRRVNIVISDLYNWSLSPCILKIKILFILLPSQG